MKTPPKCRAKREFMRPDRNGFFPKGFVFTALSATLREEWERRGLIEVIGEDAVEEKEKKAKKKRNSKGQFQKKQMVRTG